MKPKVHVLLQPLGLVDSTGMLKVGATDVDFEVADTESKDLGRFQSDSDWGAFYKDVSRYTDKVEENV